MINAGRIRKKIRENPKSPQNVLIMGTTFKNVPPGEANWTRINIDKAVPTIPAKMEKMIYRDPISLAFVENSHRVIKE